MCIKEYLIITSLLFFWQQLLAQDDRYAASYMSAVSNHAALFSGNLQQSLPFRPLNHQYFVQEDYTKGRLSYGGVIYPDVLIRWDLYRDELMVLTPANYNVVLKSEYVDFAEIEGDYIIYRRPDGLSGCPPSGFYILLYSGDNILLEKLSKTLREKAHDFDRFKRVYSFSQSSIFYLQKNGAYDMIKNRKTLLKALDTHRSELNRFIRINGLSYKNDTKKMVLEVVQEYEKMNWQ